MSTPTTPPAVGAAEDPMRVAMPKPQVAEYAARDRSGWTMLAISGVMFLLGLASGAGALLTDSSAAVGAFGVMGVALILAAVVVSGGLTPVAPGEARVIQLLGRYKGTVRTDGLRWVNPFTARKAVSTRIRNHETGVAKVNDAGGSPIEIAAVVVWQVEDTARAVFEVDDFQEFVAIQTETAVRHIANSYPYDTPEGGGMSLRDNADAITTELATEIAVRVESAGVHIVESRLTRLAYAPEIAQAMLRRQQAGAVVAARRQIVRGAVGMVEDALEQLADKNVVELDEERKATMVSNLLVVLCGDRDAQPVVNTGSLYT